MIPAGLVCILLSDPTKNTAMPEGPMMHLFRDELSVLRGLRVTELSHSRKKPDLSALEGKELHSLSTWGKYVFLNFQPGNMHLRIHWGMFGVHYIDEPRKGKAAPILQLGLTQDRDLYLYAVSLRLIEGPLSHEEYDPHIDIMSSAFDVDRAVQTMKEQPEDRMICDVLMDQTIFAGLGNVIKNESLFALRIAPESRMGGIPPRSRRTLVKDIIEQAELFFHERKAAGGYGMAGCRSTAKRYAPFAAARLQDNRPEQENG
jgi:endonuclease-8